MYLSVILNCIYATMGSLGFCVLFNIRGKNLWFSSLGGGLGWFVYLILSNLNYSTAFCLFMGSLAISIYSEILARVMKTPVTTFIIISMIPLVPGSGMYYTMFESVKGNINTSLNLGFQTIVDAGAIAVAIMLVSSLSKFILYYRSKNLKKK